MKIRRNVWDLGGDWADPILWYARGVSAMKSRALADRTSWRFFGAIHGFMQARWQQIGFYHPGEALPSKPETASFWKQCQHGSWFFLPWHRGYLLAFEAMVRDAVVTLGGPEDWTLPYWNYFKLNQDALPPAFASPDWPDGQGNNPLFVSARWGPDGSGKVYVPIGGVNLAALAHRHFVGAADGGSQGFGGIDTGFEHSGNVHGGIESQPHDQVHVFVGGADPQDENILGVMSDPDTAGLDPIFWLHHANIDRLWEVWREMSTIHADPKASRWVKGPASIGERTFSMPMPGGQTLNYTPADMESLAKLGYAYDDVTAPPGVATPAQRLVALGMPAADAALIVQGQATMAKPREVELVGASDGSIEIAGAGTSASVALDPQVTARVASSLRFTSSLGTAPSSAPDRLFLNLENVRGTAGSTVLKVYVGLPGSSGAADDPDNFAGTVGLFGLGKASDSSGDHSGEGLTYPVEVSKIIDKLRDKEGFDAGRLDVALVPFRPIPAGTTLSVGRISLTRQAG